MKNFNLFLDTTDKVTFGILSPENKWIKYYQFETMRSSDILYEKIFAELKDLKLKFSDIGKLFLASGPGSYTGMRIGEGVAQILEWYGHTVESFYHFEVPKVVGVKRGLWFSNAFKGEIFVHTWGESNLEKGLFSEEDFNKIKSKFSEDEIFSRASSGINSSDLLIESNSKSFFKDLSLKSERLKPFYYRDLSEEFKKLA